MGAIVKKNEYEPKLVLASYKRKEFVQILKYREMTKEAISVQSKISRCFKKWAA
jgi:hypothetical protein